MSDRRTFLVQMGALTATVTASASLGVIDRQWDVTVVPVARATPVVGFFLDQPYLDLTGLATPYVPPAGLRSAVPLATAFDADFHRGIWFALERDPS